MYQSGNQFFKQVKWIFFLLFLFKAYTDWNKRSFLLDRGATHKSVQDYMTCRTINTQKNRHTEHGLLVILNYKQYYKSFYGQTILFGNCNSLCASHGNQWLLTIRWFPWCLNTRSHFSSRLVTFVCFSCLLMPMFVLTLKYVYSVRHRVSNDTKGGELNQQTGPYVNTCIQHRPPQAVD